ncbi:MULTISPECIES: saccharopine dehydrogenase family protein [Alphaproteobacteria]|uniref:Saccharopine dehydrogenase n=2 Tax=Alphaproteobacteria TaxID=28211 RepID=A0A512HP41_9HYPH|nr:MULTISPECIES: saccharopine dehydrogenase C-terminal domain-containing protein [Alphaproteobacteria]GEO87201.1 saccharopine dehydrogenase [Ciceribacter naphthalenivorans]GLR23069.1 saccharopine dehydrogenase [Ciceribacter naphthalenivorans]GLT05925.1 saccharopine dehydrogenase [Sphingomonas psychrolutea]
MERLKVSIFGAGEIGTALAAALAGSDAFMIQVIDRSEEALDRLRAMNIAVSLRSFGHPDELRALLAGQDLAVAAVSEGVVNEIAHAAAMAGVHYLDFICARPETRAILEPLSARRAVFNGCGVSPGMIGNVACGLISSFSPVADLTIRVGAIPRYPTNRLGYGQIWNVDGLIDEYTRPSAAIREGQAVSVAPLEGYGHLSIDGVTYEEFVTSGGVEDLSIFADCAPRNVTFKTIRYPGHLDYMRFLLDDLGLRHRRDMLRSLLYNGLPVVEDDLLLLVVTARGYRGRQPTERTICHRFRPNRTFAPFNALTSVATGYAATLIAMLHRGDIADRGFVAHHRIDTAALLSGEFLQPLLAL